MPGDAVAPPLEGLRVLDLSTGAAGPYCTKLLADYGARVLKVEPPGGGDPARHHDPFPDDIPHPERSGAFLFHNTGKEGITLDLTTATGQDLFRRLVTKVDVVVESYPPDEAEALGTKYDKLAGTNPALVVTSLSDFGSDGPRRDESLTDLTVFAMTGFMYPMGEPTGPPVRPGGPFSGFIAGLYGCFATLMAYMSALAGGRGQQVEVSRFEAVLAALIYDVTQCSYSGEPRRRLGRYYSLKHALNLSVQPTKDDYIAFLVGPGSERWETLWEALLGMPEVLDDERFQTVEGRRAHLAELETMVQSWLRERTAEEVFHMGQALRLLFAQFLTPEDLFHNEHLRARGYFQPVDHPVAGTLDMPGPSWRLTATPAGPLRPAPTLGQHNRRVYAELLGLEPADLVRLRAAGVV